jgi:hypothetical protein
VSSRARVRCQHTETHGGRQRLLGVGANTNRRRPSASRVLTRKCEIESPILEAMPAASPPACACMTTFGAAGCSSPGDGDDSLDDGEIIGRARRDCSEPSSRRHSGVARRPACGRVICAAIPSGHSADRCHHAREAAAQPAHRRADLHEHKYEDGSHYETEDGADDALLLQDVAQEGPLSVGHGGIPSGWEDSSGREAGASCVLTSA